MAGVCLGSLLCLLPLKATDLPNFKGRTLIEVLEYLQQHRWPIVFSDRLIRPEMKVQAYGKSGSAFSVLLQILKQHEFSVQPGPQQTILIVRQRLESPQFGTELNGRAVQANGSLPLKGLRIQVVGSNRFATTGADGGFRFENLPPGTYALAILSDAWYEAEPRVHDIQFAKKSQVTLSVLPVPRYYETLKISPSLYQLQWHPYGTPHPFSSQELGQLPRLGNDPYRALSRLPGTLGDGASAKFRIRGGEEDEVLVLFNGLEIQEPFHLQGFLSLFSVFDAATIGKMDFMSGGFPAKYGTRMSGVVDIETIRAGKESTYELEFNNLYGKFIGSGQFAAGKGQWIAASRYGTFGDRIHSTRTDWRATYGDVFAEIDYRMGADWLFQMHVLGGKNRIAYQEHSNVQGTAGALEIDLDADSDQTYGWLNIHKQWHERLSSVWTLSLGRRQSSREGFSRESDFFFFFSDSEQRLFEANDHRRQSFSGFKQAWQFRWTPGYEMTWGGEWRFLAADYDYRSRYFETSPLVVGGGPPLLRELRLSPQPRGDRISAYVSNRIQWGEAWQVSGGLRVDQQRYAERNTRQWSPRFNLSYRWSNRGRAKFGWGRFSQAQGIGELQVIDGIQHFQEPQRATHLIGGVEQTFGEQFSWRLDAYKKEISNPKVRYENQLNPITLFPEGEPERLRIAPERAEVKGLELMFKHRGSHLSWFLNYSYQRADDYVDAQPIPRRWDHRHVLNASMGYHTKSGWDLNLSTHFRSGRPFTDIHTEAVPQADGTYQPLVMFGPPNGERLPATQLWDLRITRDFKLGRGRLKGLFELSNLSDNPRNCCVRYEFYLNPNGTVRRRIDKPNKLPLLPVIGLNWKF